MADTGQLPADGERYLPGMGGRIAAEHLARYSFAEQFIVDKNVLDVASGEGYGTAIMAARARSTTGVDLAEAAVRFAQKQYSKVKNTKFQVGDVTALPFAAGSFDVVTCYETIEHVDEPSKALAEVKRVLNDRGTLIVSTPNKETYSVRFAYNNPFHKKELAFDEFGAALQSLFKYVEFFGQFSSAASCIIHVQENGRLFIPNQELAVTHANVPKWTSGASKGSADPLYFVAVCSDHPLLDVGGPVEFFNASDWRLIEDDFILRKTGAELESQRASLHMVQADLHTVQADLHTVQADLHTVQADLQASKDTLGRRDAEIQTLRRAFNSLRGQHTRLNNEIDRLNNEIKAAPAELNLPINSTTWRLTSVARNKLTRWPLLRKVLRKAYRSIAARRSPI
jgi:ubiquinone/menaquinone biosynthesis C-methylase UbiE